MSEVAKIRRKLESLGALSEAVTAMSSLSAHHLRQAREVMPVAAAYEADLGQALARAGVTLSGEGPGGETLLFVVGSHLGLCGGYNGRIADAAMRRRAELGPGKTIGVGRRLVGALGRRHVEVDETLAGVTSLAGIPALALALAERGLVAQRRDGVRAVELVSARFHGIGSDRAEPRRVLPLALPAPQGLPWTVRYTTPGRLAEGSARELLYVGLVASITEALVCEHAARLLATRSAGDWLEDRVDRLRRKESAARQEQSTQETLEVVSAARAMPDVFGRI